jgi:hypothetical protein
VNESTAHPAHPSTDDHDHPHACTGGLVFLGLVVVDDDGEEVEVISAIPCRRCAGETS